ncbi:MAG: PilW family protein [Coraliomargarita sp.]
MESRSKPYSEKHRSDRKQGLTLPEMMVSLGIMAFVVGGMYSFYMTFYRLGFVNENKNLINADIREVTGELMNAGRQSNYFVLYESPKYADRDQQGDRLTDGNSGDLLVFVYTDQPDGVYNTSMVSRIVGYYRSSDEFNEDGLAPVRTFELQFDPASAAPLEELLPANLDLLVSRKEVDLAKGLSDGRLFHNFWGRSVMVNAQIYHGNEAKRITETYNFTISPRG